MSRTERQVAGPGDSFGTLQADEAGPSAQQRNRPVLLPLWVVGPLPSVANL